MLKLSYILLFIVLWSIILLVVNAAMKKTNVESKRRQKYLTICTLIIGAWFGIQHLTIESGFYSTLDLPPRIPLFMILPLFLFTFTFLFRKRSSAVLNAIPTPIPIFYQSFRAVIEVLFYYTFLQGILPEQVTFSGANYDVLLGISAIPMGIYALRKTANKKLLIAWNIIGIGVVGFAAFTFITSFYFPSFWGISATTISLKFAHYPFMLLPSFFMPSAIFVHVMSIIQLSNQLKNENINAPNNSGIEKSLVH